MKRTLKQDIYALRKISEIYNIEGFTDSLLKTENAIDKFALKVIFVGGFSAGKSALINTLLERSLLEENQRPETAIASEIIYDTNEYIEAFNGDESEIYNINEYEDIDPTQYDYLLWHLNCKNLEKLTECTIVDMPGFDSGISEHNKAILRYATNANAYVLVIDCEDGVIKKNVIDFIKEIRNYCNNIAVVVSKSDLKTPEDAEQVRKNVQRTAESLFSDKIDVVLTSKFDEDTPAKVKQIVSGFDKDSIFAQQFVPMVRENAVICLDYLETYKNSLKLDISQFDETIEMHKQAQENLSKSLKKEKAKLESKIKNSVYSITADVENALQANVEALSSAAKTGDSAFSSTVNRILRPVLISSTNKYIEQSFENFVSEIDLSENSYNDLAEISGNALDKIKQASGKLDALSQNSDKAGALYKTITSTLAITTSAIAPWLELVIVFLPDILNVLSNLMGGGANTLHNKISGEIIPQITTKLQPEIENTLMDVQEEMIENLEEEFNDLIENEVKAIESAKSEKESMSSDYNQKIEDVQQDINKVQEIINALDSI